jgi:xylulokinase
MPFLLCLDLGTSAAKAALLDLDGTVHHRADAAYPTRREADGTAEQDPRDWERAARTVLRALLEEVPAGEVLALALTGQMQDLVPVPAQGAPRAAILYSDTRAGAEAEELRRALAATGTSWDQLSGNLQDATSCAAMHLRLRRAEPERLAGLEGLVFGPAGHLVARMGLGLWCDPTTAAATGLLDARTRDWSVDVARAAGIDPVLLPALTRTAGQVVGRTGEQAAALLDLPTDLPVVLAPGDAGATTCGIVGLSPGDTYAYLGTSGWLATVLPAAPTGEVSGSSHHLALGGRARAGTAAPTSTGSPTSTEAALGAGARTGAEAPVLRISALLAAGAAADWARTAFLDGAGTARADELLTAREQERGRGPTGLLALPSILGERFPVRDAQLRGAVVGIGPGTRGIDLYAAMLEGVAHGLAHGLEDGPEHGDPGPATGRPAAVGAPRPLPVTGGGAASPPWLRILADVTGHPVRTVDGADAALLGCALVAADALGLDHSLTPLGARASSATIAPDPSAVAAHAALRPAHRALYDAAAQVRRTR